MGSLRDEAAGGFMESRRGQPLMESRSRLLGRRIWTGKPLRLRPRESVAEWAGNVELPGSGVLVVGFFCTGPLSLEDLVFVEE